MKTLIEGATIVTCMGKTIKDGCILFSDRILGIGKTRDEVGNVEDARVINGEGKTIIPGLIDCHVHLGMDLENDASDTTIGAVVLSEAQECSTYGITTVRNMGTKHNADIAVRDIINSTYCKGVRIVASGQPITITGGHGSSMSYIADSVDEARKAARTVIGNGADVIKMIATGGMGTKGSNPYAVQLSEEQMRVICEEARRAGILTGAHCTALDGAKNAIKAGVRSVEHVQMNEEIARMMRTNGTYYCPTIVTRYNILHLLDPSLQWLKQKARPTDLDGKKRAIQLCHKYGIPVCASTDSMNSSKAEHAVTKLGVSLATELHIYVEFGMTNEEALLTATKTASEMLCIGNQVGTLEVDKCADLVLLDGNPLDCIDNVSRVVKTYQRGKLSFSA